MSAELTREERQAFQRAIGMHVEEGIVYITPAVSITNANEVVIAMAALFHWLTQKDEELQPAGLPIPLYTIIDMSHLSVSEAASTKYGEMVRSMIDTFTMVIFRYGVPTSDLMQLIRLQALKNHYRAFLCPNLDWALAGVHAHQEHRIAQWAQQVNQALRYAK